MKAIHLQTEYLTEPLGLGITKPRFYWHCEGGITQTAYQISAVRDSETVWDSGKVVSSRMTHIAYEGAPLKSRDRVTWRVTLWDEDDQPGEASESWFELGLLENSDWKGKWITGDYKPKKNVRYPVDCFRKEFHLDSPVKKARLYAAARGLYDVSINGKRLEDFILAPGMTDYRKRIQYQVYDVTSLLQEKNTVELRLADGWYRGSSAAYGVTNVYGTQTSVLAQLEMVLEDGSRRTLCTSEKWSWSNDGPIRFADLKDGEIYDASLSPSYGGKAKVVSAPKDVPLCASDNVPVREKERLSAALLTAKDGTWVLDFGQNIAGYLEFSVRGKPGQILRLTCGEILDESGRVDLSGIQETKPKKGWSQLGLLKKLMSNQVKGETEPTPKQEIVFTCSGGEDHYKTSFAVFGFRYAEIDSELEIDPADFTAIAVYSDMEQTGDFTCSNELVNKLVANTRWSMKGNFLDLPTDCPTRERLGWTGDAQIFFDTGAYFMDTAPFFRKWLRDMEDAQYKSGLLPAVLPYQGVEMMYKSTGSSVGWADAVYLIPWRYYRRFGDLVLLRQCWPMMKRYGDYLVKNLEKDGHYEKGIHLGEWLEPEEFRDKVYGAQAKHPEECTAYLYLAMTTLAEIAELLGEPDYSAECREIAEGAKKVYPAFAELDTDRQAKLVRPLALGLLDGESKGAAQRRLVQAVENYRYRVGTGFLSTPFLLPVLTEAGEAETAYRMLENTERPGWLAEAAEGATTVWESWEGNVSHNHYSPGAVCQWLFDTAAGVRVDGENHFTIAPVPGGTLEWAEASYRSIYGEVSSRWEKTESALRFTICIPSNTTATVRLPNGRIEKMQAGRYQYEYNSIRPGQVWLDTNGRPIQAHGFSVFYSEVDQTYYWYGENKEKTTGGPFNKVWHWGVRCYASKDLYNWEDRGLIIPPQPDDLGSPLHPTYCMDRPHIIYCEKTGKYVAWLKIMCGTTSQFMSVMQADRFMGPYEFVHKIYKPLSMDTGDFALAVDRDTKKAYFIFSRPHFEVVTATLSDTYTEVTGEFSEHYVDLHPPFSREAPTYFERDGLRYLITSGTTGYYPNPSQVCRFSGWHGEYTDLGDPCVGDVEGTSFYGQFTCVLKVPDTDLYIAMADRWKPTSFGKWFSRKYYTLVERAMSGNRHENITKPDRSPKTAAELPRKLQHHKENTSIARYVWLPIQWEDEKPVIRWHDEWRIEDFT